MNDLGRMGRKGQIGRKYTLEKGILWTRGSILLLLSGGALRRGREGSGVCTGGKARRGLGGSASGVTYCGDSREWKRRYK